PPYTLLPSSRSSFKAIQSALGDIYDRIMQVDLGGISSDARATLQAATQLLRDQRLSGTLTHLETASESASKVTKNLEVASERLPPVVDNAAVATADARRLFANLSSGVNGQH